MDLTSATEGQKRIITTLASPLSVAAGAGSGKTFTLTNRIGYAFLGEEGDQPFIDDIEEVLAITFSKTGAAEMKSRIRLLLQTEGLEEQARQVENAWITTIHGMCARILREHALELGIDPAFEVVEDIEADELWRKARESVLVLLEQEQGRTRLSRLFDQYREANGPGASTGLSTLITRVWEKTLSMPDGFDAVRIPAQKTDLAASLRALIELAQEYRALADTWGDDAGKQDLGHLAVLDEALAAALSYQQRTDLDGASFESPDLDMAEYLDIVLAFPKLSAKYRAKKPDAAFFEGYRRTYAEIAQAVVLDAAAVVSADLVDLVKLVDGHYQQLKGASRLDNTDLLRLANDALWRDPALRAAYQQQFKLIMVDEFQDTDLLQVSIIDALSRDHGHNVMTVGDAQQGIYRFRGADVEVFYRHRETQRATHADLEVISLPDNFRSHGDILALVDTIFSRPAFFGENFLSLQPKGPMNALADPLFAESPRVVIEVFESRARGGGSLLDARTKAARAIAQRFADLRAQGASPSDMVILLGSLTNVGIYTQALAEAGFESIVSGGSVFARAPEVQLTDALLTALADRTNSTALYTVLESPLFDLSDEALFLLASGDFEQAGAPAHACFAQRFWNLANLSAQEGSDVLAARVATALSDAASSRELVRAVTLLSRFAARVEQGDIACALHELFTDSGWFYRLQEEGARGQAVAANLFKAIDIVADLNARRPGIQYVARDLSAFLVVSKQAPGVLSAVDSDLVQIMSIHASKGLEFDHVAVAEIRSGLPKASPLRLDTLGDQVLLSLKPKLSSASESTYRALGSYLEHEAPSGGADLDPSDLSALDLSALLDERIARGELDDAQRLLYVALTRAAKSLCFCLTMEGNKDFDYTNKGIIQPLYETFAWQKEPEPKQYLFDYGGSAPAIIRHEALAQKPATEALPERAERGFTIVEPPAISAQALAPISIRHDVVSYSSIAPDHGHATWQADEVDPDALDEAFIEDMGAQLKQQSAVAFGTAFHLLAQRAIASRQVVGQVPEIPQDAIVARIERGELSCEQATRLRSALARWFGSDLCARFFAASTIAAEVPFMLELQGRGEQAGTHLFLEGEIDGLAIEGRDEGSPRALFIDYKTGGSADESDEALHDKHLLQARCYALALLRQGFGSVEANFIRVERACPSSPEQPQVVTYAFNLEDVDALEDAILSAYRAHEG